MSFYASYPVSGGGVTSLDGMTGALTLVAGTNITIVDAPGTITISAAGLQPALTIGALDSQAANANGLSLVSNVLSTQSADATHPGMVNTTTQTFTGDKTFAGILTVGQGTSTGAPNAIFESSVSGPAYIEVIAGTTTAGLGVNRSVEGTVGTFTAHPFHIISSNIHRITVDSSGNIFFLDPSLAGASNGYVWTLTDQTTGQGAWAAAAGTGAITALTGDATATGPGSAALTLATVNANVGSFGSASSVATFTVNGKGLTTAAASTSIQIAESQVTNLVSDLAGKQPIGNYITALTGDATASGPGSAALTLATVNANIGSFGSATSVATFTTNAKGLITAAGSTSIQITESQVTNLTTDLAGKLTSTLASADIFVGNGSNVATAVAVTGAISLTNAGLTAYAGTVPLNKGGTGQTTKAPAFDALQPMTTGGDVIYGGASGTGTRLANGTSGQVLTSNGGTSAPSWTTIGGTTSVVVSYNGRPTGSIDNSGTQIATIPTLIVDTNSAYSGGAFTAPVAANYRVSAQLAIVATIAVGGAAGLYIRKNGGIVTNTLFFSEVGAISRTYYVQVDAIVPLAGGDNVTITVYSDGAGLSYDTNAAGSYICINSL